MDMLHNLNRLVSPDDDHHLRREVENAYADESPPTPANELLERIMVRAEASPQASPEHDDVMTTDAPETAVASAIESPSVAQKQQGWLARLLENQAETPKALQQQLHTLRSINWELYHEYLEQNIYQVSAGSGLKL